MHAAFREIVFQFFYGALLLFYQLLMVLFLHTVTQSALISSLFSVNLG